MFYIMTRKKPLKISKAKFILIEKLIKQRKLWNYTEESRQSIVGSHRWHSKLINRLRRTKLICDVLRDLVAFVHFKKREKQPWKSVNFSKVAG